MLCSPTHTLILSVTLDLHSGVVNTKSLFSILQKECSSDVGGSPVGMRSGSLVVWTMGVDGANVSTSMSSLGLYLTSMTAHRTAHMLRTAVSSITSLHEAAEGAMVCLLGSLGANGKCRR